MGGKRRIYPLSGMPPEVIAVAFAKCSRSPDNFDVIANELNEDKSRQFHEKWVVGYGHSSVAEHACLSLAIEGVSMLATKVIEDNRLASFTEKSTRYQEFSKDSYYTPNLPESLKEVYKKTSDEILDTYTDLIPKITLWIKKENLNAKEIEIKNKAFDIVRSILPVSVTTNLGLTINARNLEWGIIKLLTSPLKEMNDIGLELKEAGLKIVPTLLKHLNVNDYLKETEESLSKVGIKKDIRIKESDGNEVSLIDFDKDAEKKLAAAIIYRHSQVSYKEAQEKAESLSYEETEKIIEDALNRLGKFDRPIRELEHIFYTFDVLMDYGSFRDVQRHRMCTQTNQNFTPAYGYIVPEEIKLAGFEKEFTNCMQIAAQTYNEIAKTNPNEAAYILPMAYRKRLLMKMNLRELFHFIKLRSGKMGHISYRDIAWRMYDHIKETHPILAKYIEVDKEA